MLMIQLAGSEEDLQDALSAMFNYCNTLRQQVNVKKIAVCSRGKIRNIPDLFLSPLQNVVDNNTYLGAKFNGFFCKRKTIQIFQWMNGNVILMT